MKIKFFAIVLTTVLSGCASYGDVTNSTAGAIPAKTPVSESANTNRSANITSSQTSASASVAGSGAENDNDSRRSVHVDPVMKSRLNSCLTEAKQLAKMRNGAYRASVDELYRNLKATQTYANLAGELSATTTDLMTPLYQYRVTNSCNTISQLLLKELQKGSMIN